MRRFSLTILVCLGGSLAACGGGGGGGSTPSGGGGNTGSVSGNVAAPSAGPGDTAGYFPLAVGSAWKFDEIDTDAAGTPSSAQTSISVTGTKSVLGANASVFSLASTITGFVSYDQFYAASGGGVTFYGNDDATDPVTNKTVPFAELLFPVAVGPVSSVSVAGLAAGTDGSGNPITTTFSQKVAVTAIETVTTGAGVFNNAAKVVTTTTGTATDAALGQSISFSSTDASWYAPGVGAVQDQSTSTVAGSTTSRIASARGYTVGGIRHGLDFPTSVFATPAASNQGPLVASNGSSFLVVANGTSQLIATLLDANGAFIKAITIPVNGTYQYAVAFDGTNYEVAFAPAFHPQGGVSDLDVQRITPTGTMLDGNPGYMAATTNGVNGFAGSMAWGSGNGLIAVISRTAAGLSPTQLSVLFVTADALAPVGGLQNLGVINLTPDANLFSMPQVAFDGTNFLIVWAEAPDGVGTSYIYGLLVDATGTFLGSGPFIIANGSADLYSPAVAYDGTNYLVTWVQGQNVIASHSQIFGTRVSPAATVLDGGAASGGKLLSSSAQNYFCFHPALAYNGTEFLVTWVESPASGQASVRGVRVSTAANSVAVTSGADFEIPINGAPPNATVPQTRPGPAVALTPSAGLVAWLASQSNNPAQIYGVSAHPF